MGAGAGDGVRNKSGFHRRDSKLWQFCFCFLCSDRNRLVVDTTHSFNLALVIAACVTFTGALCYFFIVKDRIE